MERIYMDIEMRVAFQVWAVTHNYVSSGKRSYLQSAYANYFWRHLYKNILDACTRTSRHSPACLSVCIHYNGPSHKQFCTPWVKLLWPFSTRWYSKCFCSKRISSKINQLPKKQKLPLGQNMQVNSLGETTSSTIQQHILKHWTDLHFQCPQSFHNFRAST